MCDAARSTACSRVPTKRERERREEVVADLRLAFSCAMSVSPAASVALYRDLLRAAKGFTNYNFREYACRRVRESMRENVSLSDGAAIHRAYAEGRVQLDMLRRQATVSALFPQERHAMETAD